MELIYLSPTFQKDHRPTKLLTRRWQKRTHRRLQLIIASFLEQNQPRNPLSSIRIQYLSARTISLDPTNPNSHATISTITITGHLHDVPEAITEYPGIHTIKFTLTHKTHAPYDSQSRWELLQGTGNLRLLITAPGKWTNTPNLQTLFTLPNVALLTTQSEPNPESIHLAGSGDLSPLINTLAQQEHQTITKFLNATYQTMWEPPTDHTPTPITRILEGLINHQKPVAGYLKQRPLKHVIGLAAASQTIAQHIAHHHGTNPTAFQQLCAELHKQHTEQSVPLPTLQETVALTL